MIFFFSKPLTRQSLEPEVKRGQSEEQLKWRQYFGEGFVIVQDFIQKDPVERLKKEWEDKGKELVEKLDKADKRCTRTSFTGSFTWIRSFWESNLFSFCRRELEERAFIGNFVLLHKVGHGSSDKGALVLV